MNNKVVLLTGSPKFKKSDSVVFTFRLKEYGCNNEVVVTRRRRKEEGGGGPLKSYMCVVVVKSWKCNAETY